MKIAKYQRQITLNKIGAQGQNKIFNSKVLVLGLGGLGSPVSMYLAAAGVGTIGICDFDIVDESNLQRQILFNENEIGKSKVKVAQKKLMDLNSDIQINTHDYRIDAENAEQIISEYDIVIDGTDHFESKYLVNDVCVKFSKPFIYGSILGFDGEVGLFDLKNNTNCLRCFHPESPKTAIPNCSTSGVVGGLAGIVGSIQALEAIKYLTENTTLANHMLFIQSLELNFRKLKIKKRVGCLCTKPKNEIQITHFKINHCLVKGGNVNSSELEKIIQEERCILLDVREEDEWNAGHIESAIHWPLKRIMNGEFPSIINGDPHANIVLYCHSGVRSKTAQEILIENGFKNTKNFSLGIVGWTGKLQKPKIP